MNQNTTTFEMWAVVELFGHTKLSGKCTEQNVAGANMLRVDVPTTENTPAFTRLLNHAAIYAINPCTEEIARHLAVRFQAKPIDVYDIRSFLAEKNLLQAPQQPSPPDDDNDDF
jgi:hypothetical protein